MFLDEINWKIFPLRALLDSFNKSQINKISRGTAMRAFQKKINFCYYFKKKIHF